MYYYEVDTLIDFGGAKKLLTYSSESKLSAGAIVEAPYGRKSLLVIVEKEVGKPPFATKSINKVVVSTSVPKPWLKLMGWFRSYYPLVSDQLHNLFMPSYLKPDSKVKQITNLGSKVKDNLILNPDQRKSLKLISQSTTPIILHGDMGSGKTLVYQEASKNIVQKGQSVLILAPEIPIATQMFKEFCSFFDNISVMLYHSNLTNTERRSVWFETIQTTKPFIVIGTRSALFLPLSNIGLVCVDEMHENAYKQQDSPYYHAIDTASQLARLQKSKIVFGSATPPIKEYYLATQRNYPVVRMQSQAATKTKNQRTVVLVDQKKRDEFSADPYLSNSLLKAVEAALGAGKQALIFHNRRGTARVIMCSKCSWSLKCPNCDLNLAYHHDKHICRCHACGLTRDMPTVCPDCGNTDLLLKSIGVKALEERIKGFFPAARVARFDSDNLKSESLGSRIDELRNGEIDIIIGTQLVAKGLDLKNLQVVGITNADSSLTLPDYTSSERLFQLTVQTMGRVGRGHGDGICVIQTYQPNNPVFETLEKTDWNSFYNTELAERRLYEYPPFTFLLKLTCRRKTEQGAEKAANSMIKFLGQFDGVKVIGPSPAFFARIGGLHQWQIVVKSKHRSRLLNIAKNIPANWQAELDPVGLL